MPLPFSHFLLPQVLVAVHKLVEGRLLYARVDMARAGVEGPEASQPLVLMEVELLEPHFYMVHDGTGGKRAAEAFIDAVLEIVAEEGRREQ